MSANVELNHEVTITAQNGTTEQSVKTPFNISFSDIQQIFIEKTDKVVKRLSIYPNGCVVYFENDANKATIRTNWPIEKDSNGDLVIVEQT